MTTEEVNEARMWGVRPSQGAGPIPVGKIPDGAAQKYASAGIANTISELRVVGAGAILYLTFLALYCYNGSGGIATGRIYIATSLDAFVVDLLRFYLPDGAHETDSTIFFPPFEVSTGAKLNLESTAAGFAAYGVFHGYEI